MARLDPRGWLGDVAGKRVLCLGAGGGKHGPLFATAGAIVTVVDISDEMLTLDREFAARLGLTIVTVQASIDELGILNAAPFDLVVQPVSTCYVPNVERVYQEVAKVIVPHGIYVSQHKTPTNLQARVVPSAAGYELVVPYYSSLALPEVEHSRLREAGTFEFLHRWEQLIGDLCRSGFVIEDLVEQRHDVVAAEPGTFGHRAQFIAPYVRIKARRVASSTQVAPRLILP
jgi:SAM-dependent methyltransferase